VNEIILMLNQSYNQSSLIQLSGSPAFHGSGSRTLGVVICGITVGHEDTDRWFFGFIFETHLQTA
jgi:hypothetical protein